MLTFFLIYYILTILKILISSIYGCFDVFFVYFQKLDVTELSELEILIFTFSMMNHPDSPCNALTYLCVKFDTQVYFMIILMENLPHT